MLLFFSFVISVAISLLLIPLLMRYAGALHMLDQPGERKVHAIAIPRCGGLGLSIGAIVAMALLIPIQNKLLPLLAGSVVILLFGIIDDRFELNYKWKFLGQFIAVLIAISGGSYISYLPFLGLEPITLLITLPLTVVFVIGVTNAVNLSDGLDGLAAGIMLMTLTAIAYLAIEGEGTDVAIMSLAIAGGIVGFLWFNTHPAVVFMGDTGSQFIGFMAVFLAIDLTQDVNQLLNPALPLLLLGLPILDTLSVMVRRVRAGRSPFSPDKTHIHHRLMEYGFSHAEAVGSIYLLQAVFLASAIAFRYASDILVIGTFLLISASILLFFYWAGKNKWTLHKSLEGKDRRSWSIWRSTRLFHFCRHYINFGLGAFLFTQLYCLYERIILLTTDAYWVILAFIVLFLILPKYIQDVWVRFSIYIAAIFASVMAKDFPEILIHTHWIMDVFLFSLIVVVSVAIRITRKSKFRMTTQDVLVLLFIFASLLLIDSKWLEHITYRLFCLVYALEYLLHREVYKFRVTRYLASLSGIIIITIVLPTFQLA